MSIIAMRSTLTSLLFACLALTACGGGQQTASSNSSSTYAATVTQVAPALADYNDVVQQVYVGYFGRPADAGGLAYFEAQFLAAQAPPTVAGLSQAYNSNASVRALVDSFSNSAESAALYPGDNNTFILAIYQNLFNRVADDAGKSYWADLITRGLITRGNAAISIMAGARSTDATIIINKTLVASNFTTALDTAEKKAAYSGLVANVSVRTMLGTVTDTTNVMLFATTITTTLSNLMSVTTVCAASNFTIANYNAIALGMTLNQVSQTIGCVNDLTKTQRSTNFVAYEWYYHVPGANSYTIIVYFDPNGSNVAGLYGTPTIKQTIGF